MEETISVDENDLTDVMCTFLAPTQAHAYVADAS
jgi:hypothetical protein